MSKFTKFSDVITTTLKSHSQALADNVTQNNTMLERWKRNSNQRLMWRKAVNNMPWKSKKYKSIEKRHALAKCLGIKSNYVDLGLNEGLELEADAEFCARLKSYTGSYGTQLAALKLASLGVIDQYPHWPTP